MSLKTWGLIALYLPPVIAANLIVTHFAKTGHPEISAYTAFGLIALTFVARDRLHDQWRTLRWAKMGALIAAGSALAYVANPDSARIALASCAAFAVSESLDALSYQAAHAHPWLVRSNVSNIVGAVADSLVFVLIAFPGGFLFLVAFGQTTAKIAGGLLFSFVLARRQERALATA